MTLWHASPSRSAYFADAAARRDGASGVRQVVPGGARRSFSRGWRRVNNRSACRDLRAPARRAGKAHMLERSSTGGALTCRATSALRGRAVLPGQWPPHARSAAASGALRHRERCGIGSAVASGERHRGERAGIGRAASWRAASVGERGIMRRAGARPGTLLALRGGEPVTEICTQTGKKTLWRNSSWQWNLAALLRGWWSD